MLTQRLLCGLVTEKQTFLELNSSFWLFFHASVCVSFKLSVFSFCLSRARVFWTHKDEKTHSARTQPFVLTFDLRLLPQCKEINPAWECPLLSDRRRFPPPGFALRSFFLGTFQGTFSCLAMCGFVYRAAKALATQQAATRTETPAALVLWAQSHFVFSEVRR